MPVKKSELYSALWEGCNQLRGGMDASQYKDYVLVMLFIKYVSDKYAGKKDAQIVLPKGASFKDMVQLKNNPNIGTFINTKIIGPIADANDLRGVIDVADFNEKDKLGDGKEMIDRLSNLIAIFENPALDFSKNGAGGDDLLGDAYEFLMRHFATESGKSKGQFYTPAEVSRIIAKVIEMNEAKSSSQTIFDPTCGSGSLLLKSADEAPVKISIYGQEKDNATCALAKMNMILHANEEAEIRQGNSLAHPLFINDRTGDMEAFDWVVSNPPFSDKAWGNGVDTVNDIHHRFQHIGVPPNKNGDYAFLLHVIKSMNSKGRGAIILPHGVLFRGGAEATIRKNILERGYIKGIIGLPANLFYGTGIPAGIIVLDKREAQGRDKIFMIDASKNFIKDGNKNRLREQDIHKIVDVFLKETKVPGYARMVLYEEIERNEYNLNLPRYIDNQEAEDLQDIEAHLHGGIPKADVDALQNYWQVYPALKNQLFKKADRKDYYQLNTEPLHIRMTIFGHPQFVQYAKEMHQCFTNWSDEKTRRLKAIAVGDHPKKLIHHLSETLLTAFADKQLIDTYDIYQLLMNYWAETMQDDVYILVSDGWQAGNEFEYDEKKNDWEGRLIPKSLMTSHYFADEQIAIEQYEAEHDELKRQLEELEEEHTGEDGLLQEAMNEKGKLTKASVQKRSKELQKTVPLVAFDMAAENNFSFGDETLNEEDDERELKLLIKYAKLQDDAAILNKQIAVMKKNLEEQVQKKYRALTEKEIKTLVVEEKWIAKLLHDVHNELDRISHRLELRIKELGERYETPLPQIITNVKTIEKNVIAHLYKMGFEF